MNKTISMLVAAGALVGAQQVAAVTFEGSAVGSWENPNNPNAAVINTPPTGNNDAGGNAILDWGVPVRGSITSRFTFDGVGSDGGPGFSAEVGDAFSLGNFDYRNGVNTQSKLLGADLAVAITLTSPLADNKNFTFQFSITVTDNTTGDPVLDSDIVTVSAGGEQDTIEYNGVQYTVEILGFSDDGGATIKTDFTSPEGGSSSAQLYARIIGVAVPDGGATAMLLGVGVLGLAGLRRKMS